MAKVLGGLSKCVTLGHSFSLIGPTLSAKSCADVPCNLTDTLDSGKLTYSFNYFLIDGVDWQTQSNSTVHS